MNDVYVLRCQFVFFPVDEAAPLEGTVPDDDLRAMLKGQLEYYFSRYNLKLTIENGVRSGGYGVSTSIHLSARILISSFGL